MEKDKSLLNNAMYYGLFFGLFLVVYSALTQITGISKSILTQGMGVQIMAGILSIVIYFVGVSISQVHYRKNKLNNVMSYGQALTFGILVTFFASFLTAIYTFIYTTWINPDFLQEVFELTKETTVAMLERFNSPDEAIEQAMAKIEEKGPGTPASQALNGIWGGLIMGGIVSLLTSIFTKKAATNPFDEISNTEE